MVAKKELLFPFVYKCCSATNDIFWKSIFEDLSYGICPMGTYISKDLLISCIKGKEFTYRITEPKDTETLYKELYELFTVKLGLFSNKEYREKLAIFEQFQEKIKIDNNDWGKIRKKNIKDLILDKYIVENMKKYSLGYPLMKKVLALIYLSFQFKIIGNKDVEFSEGKITRIHGIGFKKGIVMINNNIRNFFKIPNVELL